MVMYDGNADLGWWGKQRHSAHLGTPHFSPCHMMMLLSMIINIINITDNMRDDLEANRVLAPLIEHAAETQHVQCNTHCFDAPS
jgi:hypothetical protein